MTPRLDRARAKGTRGTHFVVRALSKATSPLLVPLAASGLIPLWGVVKHVGRRSGRRYATPVAVRPTSAGFVLPLPFSEGVDWCRNVVAAGGGVVRWGGRDYAVVEPQVIGATEAGPSFSPLQRFLIRRTGISRFLAVRRAA